MNDYDKVFPEANKQQIIHFSFYLLSTQFSSKMQEVVRNTDQTNWFCLLSQSQTYLGKSQNNQIRAKKKKKQNDAVIRRYGSLDNPVEGQGIKISASFTQHSWRIIQKMSHSPLLKPTSPLPTTEAKTTE